MAARGLRRWAAGVLFGVASSIASWLVVFDVVLDFTSAILLVSSGLGVAGVALAFSGARGYVGALPDAFGAWPRVLVGALGMELALHAVWLVVQVLQEAAHADLHALTDVLVTVSPVFVLASFAALLATVVVAGRVATVVGATLPAGLVWALLATQGTRFVFRALRELDVQMPGGPWAGAALFVAGEIVLYMLLSQHATDLAGLASRVPGPSTLRDESKAAWAEPGRALATYRNAVLAQLVVAVVAAILAMAARSYGTSSGLLSVSALVSFVVSLVVVVSVVRYAWTLPDAAAANAAKIGAVLMGVHATAGLVSTALTLRALSDGGLSALFEVQAWLPIAEGAARVFGLFGLVALLHSFDAVGQALGERALRVRTRGLKIVFPVLAGCAVAAQMASMLGPLVAVFALGFAVGALATLGFYLRLVGDVAELMLARSGAWG
ncbi:MAG: hypothetical protein KC586_15895 [Myxococcales bacterium]|nr:hypothetical protein [Myxococcales bacterium]